ncbi:hypothetical protein FANTH_1278 [Fusarium anthophilum]|uniref:Rhodopsin domain-containing protein n=1 Tax=Fusarium anthophilum TaxID=48485 RepID=A0A8H5EBB6_9HYPO|nr:hypothetical protein FANTH_1278 [Fusarium anthophilum]
MDILIAHGVANTFFILLQCRSLEASWDAPVLETAQGASCLPQPGIHIMSSIGSDALPLEAQRPLKEKFLVGALMGLGMFASVASIVKATLVKETGMAKDAWALTNSIATWTALSKSLS